MTATGPRAISAKRSASATSALARASLSAPTASGPPPTPTMLNDSSSSAVAVARAATGDRFWASASAGATYMVQQVIGTTISAREVCQEGARQASARLGAQTSIER